MRITACQIEAFGPFQERAFDGFDHPVVVVQGPNEAGKTSLFHFFREMLYGIEPPDGARHPYAPAAQAPEASSGGAAEAGGDTPPLGGRLRYRLADGTPRTVHRRLTGAPQGRLTEDGAGGDEEGQNRPVDLQNRPLPAVAHVSREVFSAVYALDGRALGDLQGAAREEVQERLLRMMSAPGVRPAEDVTAALDAEAARLWSPAPDDDPAGDDPADDERDDDERTEAARLRTRRCALRQKLECAQQHDRERRKLMSAVADGTDRLEALEAERANLKAHLRRAERLRPVRALVSRLEAHTDRAGDLAPFEDVPEEPIPVLRRLEREIERYEDDLAQNERARAEARATRDAFTDADRRIEAEADAVRAWGDKAAAHERRAEHREELLRESERIAAVLDERAQRLFDAPWSDDLARALHALPKNELEARVDAYRDADSTVDALEVRADALARKVDRRKRLWPWAIAAGIGLAAFAAGVVLGRELVWGLATALAATGLLQLLNAWNYNRERAERLGELDLEIEEQEEVLAEKSAAVAELLGDLPLTEEEAAHPDHELWDALQELRRQAEERAALHRQADALADTLDEDEASVHALARRCGVRREEHKQDAALPQIVAALEKRLDAAEERRREAEAAEERLETLRERRRDLEPALEKRRRRYDGLKAKLHDLDDDLATAVEELKARRRAARRAEQARATLFREHPDWKSLRDEIRALEEDDADGWAYTDEEVVRMRERREAIADEILDTEQARTRKREDAQRLAQHPAPADVASKLATVERRLDEVGRRRDRLALLARLIRRAARSFRRRHQPEVVKQAGRYLRTITGGRYQRLVLEGQERRLHVCRTEESAPEPVRAPLSQGVRDQVYAALRLALIDHLDQSQEALPVFLDEVFTSWDRGRRQHGYAVLEELTERRQVFIFTCHPALSEELSRRLDARRLLLEPT
jgi:uncharacterized protein YhaN